MVTACIKPGQVRIRSASRSKLPAVRIHFLQWLFLFCSSLVTFVPVVQQDRAFFCQLNYSVKSSSHGCEWVCSQVGVLVHWCCYESRWHAQLNLSRVWPVRTMGTSCLPVLWLLLADSMICWWLWMLLAKLSGRFFYRSVQFHVLRFCTDNSSDGTRTINFQYFIYQVRIKTGCCIVYCSIRNTRVLVNGNVYGWKQQPKTNVRSKVGWSVLVTKGSMSRMPALCVHSPGDLLVGGPCALTAGLWHWDCVI